MTDIAEAIRNFKRKKLIQQETEWFDTYLLSEKRALELQKLGNGKRKIKKKFNFEEGFCLLFRPTIADEPIKLNLVEGFYSRTNKDYTLT